MAQLVEARPELPATVEELSAGIIDLTNKVFERAAPRLRPFIEDSRRDRGSDGAGTTLTSDNENVLWEKGRYGDFSLYTPDSDNHAQLYSAFSASLVGKETLGVLGVADPHTHLLTESNVLVEDKPTKRYKPLGGLLLLRALRDRYPRGDTQYRLPLMTPETPYEEIPPEDWGERHGIGVQIIAGYEDALVPERKARWQLDFQLQNRFDKAGPQSKITSTFSGLVDTRDIRSYRPFEPRVALIRRPTESVELKRVGFDLAFMRRLFDTAKDLRPLVTPIHKQLDEQAKTQGMIDSFLSPVE
ncbi:MAG TPA: hypothetical protein VHC21_02640 [Candidatus Saccharimonadales bacterium]|nr:hypothetical protein [Candidatus Saccharimonadales bacterium]